MPDTANIVISLSVGGALWAGGCQYWAGMAWSTDTPLAAAGRQQLQRLGQHFHSYLPHIDAIYTSPLKRSRITAEHIAVTTGKSVILDRRRMEQGVGESLRDVTTRFVAALEE